MPDIVNSPDTNPPDDEPVRFPVAKTANRNETLKGLATARIFAREYLRNGRNGTEAAMKVYGTENKQYAAVQSNRLLKKANFRTALLEEMQNTGLDERFIREHLRRNIAQNKNPAASNQAIDTVLKVAGAYAPERKETVTLNLDGDDIDGAIKRLTDELKALDLGKSVPLA